MNRASNPPSCDAPFSQNLGGSVPSLPYNPALVNPALPQLLAAKRRRVLARLRAERGEVVVAFSGGVDSTLLLALALEALGPERVLAVTAASESLPASELEECRGLAAQLGARHEILRTRELARPGYVANAGDRCYHCKSELFESLAAELDAGRFGSRSVVYGATLDDLGDYRPGLRAAAEAGAIAPLADAELGKAEIRELSAALRLPTWDKPAHPCLASRVPHGEEVTAAKLAMIEGAEAVLRRLGYRELRVRHHELQGPSGAQHLARIVLAGEGAAHFPEAGLVSRELRALGYAFVTLDLEGLRSGRLNDALPAAQVEPLRRLPVTT